MIEDHGIALSAMIGWCFQLDAPICETLYARGRKGQVGRSALAVKVRTETAKELRALDWSYPRIARAMGLEHHTSVMVMVKR